MSKIRKQLTLFLNHPTIEKVREKFNPLQFALIPAHVTLCREDEIEELGKVISNIKKISLVNPLEITFDKVSRFDNDNGVFLAAKPGQDHFNNLRASIIDSPSAYLPHVTLMHPRNSTCTDELFNQIKSYEFPSLLTFDQISLIEQKNDEKWTILEEFLICL